MRVQIMGPIQARHAERIVAAFPNVEMFVSDDADGSRPIDALLSWEAEMSKVKRVIQAHPSLRWVHIIWAGVPDELLEAVEGHPAVLTNGSGPWAPPIAEHTLAVILAFYQRLPELYAYQQRAEWAGKAEVSELLGRTVGIVGLGDLGLLTARRLRPFGVRILGMRRRPEPLPEIDQLYPQSELHAFLAQLDILILAPPLTKETRGLIGAAELAQMRRGAYLVNIGRGPLVDEDALIAALRSGHLGGAALDVFNVEPLPPESPFWTLPNVIVTPHRSDRSEATLQRVVDLYVDNLGRFVRREPLQNVVDRELGY